jgi:cytochrome bd-type quinol oxidase subunit 2
MLSPARLTQLLTEFVFLLLGALVMWFAANGRIDFSRFDRHSRSWLVLSVALIAWGLLALAKPGQFRAKWQKWNRGGSLVLLGVVMLALSRVPFDLVVKLLAAAGLILIVRGILGSLLILRQR